MKQGIREFHRKYVLVPADKAANNVVVVCRLHYVYTLKQELDGTRAYLETDTDEMSVVNAHLNDLPVKFSVCVNEGPSSRFQCFTASRGSNNYFYLLLLFRVAALKSLPVQHP